MHCQLYNSINDMIKITSFTVNYVMIYNNTLNFVNNFVIQFKSHDNDDDDDCQIVQHILNNL